MIYNFYCKEKYEQWKEKQATSFLFWMFPFGLRVTAVFYLFKVIAELKWSWSDF